MRTVRRFVGDLWKETNRLNAKEVGHTLADMYYASASLGAHEVPPVLLAFAAYGSCGVRLRASRGFVRDLR